LYTQQRITQDVPHKAKAFPLSYIADRFSEHSTPPTLSPACLSQSRQEALKAGMIYWPIMTVFPSRCLPPIRAMPSKYTEGSISAWIHRNHRSLELYKGISNGCLHPSSWGHDLSWVINTECELGIAEQENF